MALWWGLAVSVVTLMMATGWAQVEDDARTRIITPQKRKVSSPPDTRGTVVVTANSNDDIILTTARDKEEEKGKTKSDQEDLEISESIVHPVRIPFRYMDRARRLGTNLNNRRMMRLTRRQMTMITPPLLRRHRDYQFESMEPSFRPSPPHHWRREMLLEALGRTAENEVEPRRRQFDSRRTKTVTKKRRREKKNEEEGEGDVITLDDIPDNGRGVDTQEFRTVVNTITVGKDEKDVKTGRGGEDDETESLTISERRDADGSRTLVVETGTPDRERKRRRMKKSGDRKGRNDNVERGGRVYDRTPWMPVTRSKYLSKMARSLSNDKLGVSDPYETNRKKRKRGAKKPSMREKILKEFGLEDEDLMPKSRRKRTKKFIIHKKPRRLEEEEEEEDEGEMNEGDVMKEGRSPRVVSADPDDPPLSEIDGGFFDEYVIDFPKENQEPHQRHRYQERPLPQEEEEEEEEYSSEYSDDYSEDDQNDPRYPQHKPHQQQQQHDVRHQQHSPYNSVTPNLQSYNLRHKNNRPGYPPAYYGQGHKSPYQRHPQHRGPPPPTYNFVRPQPQAPAFRSPNPYYKAKQRPQRPHTTSTSSEYDVDDEYHYNEDKGRYKKFNFYDELIDDDDKTQARMRGRVTYEQGFHGTSKIPRPPFVYAGGNKFNRQRQHNQQQQQLQQQQLRNNGPSFRSHYPAVKPGPNYESFRVPPPQQRLRHNLAHVVQHQSNPDKEAFARLHAGYFNKGRSHGQEEEEEESPGYTDGYVNDDHEDEDEDEDGLAPNSVYQEEVRGVGHRPNRYGDRGKHKQKYTPMIDYEDRGEEDIMGVAEAPGGQPVYPEEQEYETREEEESDVAVMPHVTGEEREEQEEEEEEDDPEEPYRPRYVPYRGQDDDEEGEEEHEERDGVDDTLREYNDEQEEDEGEMEARYRPSYRQEDTRHRGRHHGERDRDYYDVGGEEEEDERDFDSTGSGGRDNHWDEYFDGARKAIDYDIGGLIMNDESYEPDGGGGVDNSGKQPQEEDEGEEVEDEGQGARDYDQREEEEPRHRSSEDGGHVEEVHHGRSPRYESSGSDRSDETGGSSSVDYDTYMELQKKERDLEKDLEHDVDKKFTDMYRGRQGANAGNKPHFLSFEHVHEPQRHRTGGGGSRGWRAPFSGVRQNADTPGFDDFFTKIEDAVDHEIGDSPFQEGRSGSSVWESPRHDGDDTDEQPDGVADNSGDLRPTVYDAAVKPDSLGFRMPSHAELEENYKTVVTSGSEHDPVVVAAFEPKRTHL